MNTPAESGLNERLRSLLLANPGLEAAALVSVDGLPIAADLPEEYRVERLAAMAAAVLSLGERMAEDFDRGALQQVLIRGENGWLVMAASGSEAVLVALLAETDDETATLAAVCAAAVELGELIP